MKVATALIQDRETTWKKGQIVGPTLFLCDVTNDQDQLGITPAWDTLHPFYSTSGLLTLANKVKALFRAARDC
jgi:hypothetical protein